MFTWKLLLFVSLSVSTSVPNTENMEISKRSARILESIRTESDNTLQMKWNTVTQTPLLLVGHLTKPSAHSPSWITFRYLERIKSLYGLKHVERDLNIVAIDQGTASTKVTLQRKLFKHTVCGDQLVVELDQTGVVQRISGTVHPGLEEKRLGRPMYPAVSVEDAKRTAVAYDTSLMPFKPISEVSCYLPSRNGIPLVHKLTYEKDGQLITIMIHSMTGRIIQ